MVLRLARDKQRMRVFNTYAVAPGDTGQSTELVFMSMSHHVRPGRRRSGMSPFCEPTGVLRRSANRSVRSVLQSVGQYEQVLPASGDVRAAFAAAGLQMVASQTITQTIASDWTIYAEKLAAGGDSVLARLRRQDFDQGLAAVRRHATVDGLRPVVEPIDLFVFRSVSRTEQPG